MELSLMEIDGILIQPGNQQLDGAQLSKLTDEKLIETMGDGQAANR